MAAAVKTNQMKRNTIVLFVVLIGIFVIFRFCNSKPDAKQEVGEQRQEPLATPETSDGSTNPSISL